MENDCHDDPCMNGATCRDDLGYFRCNCPEGFIGNRCELGKYCFLFHNISVVIYVSLIWISPYPSFYKLHFLISTLQYSCVLLVDFQTPCIPNPCHNYGVCNITGFRKPSYKCTCPDGYDGLTCKHKDLDLVAIILIVLVSVLVPVAIFVAGTMRI